MKNDGSFRRKKQFIGSRSNKNSVVSGAKFCIFQSKHFVSLVLPEHLMPPSRNIRTAHTLLTSENVKEAHSFAKHQEQLVKGNV